jgi:hypothetical protein
MNNKILKLFFVALIISLASCESYLDVNETPNQALLSQVTPNLALSAAQTQTYRSISGDNRNIEGGIFSSNLNQFGNVMMNSWAGNVNTTGDPYGSEYRSAMTTSFYQSIWNYSYLNIANLSNITKYPSGDYDNHKAIAKILISFYMQNIVDLYGDCPYSQAFLGNDNLTPAYDDDKDIYRSLLTNLDQAITLIGAADAGDAVVGTEDAMMAGNMDKWVRFANTIKLRLLIRQSGLTDAGTITYLNTELNKLAATNKFLIDDVTINPGYSNAGSDNQNPFYGQYGYTISGGATSNRSFIVASRNAATKLNSTADARRGRLFTLVTGNVVGIDQGESALAAPDIVSSIGAAIVPVPVAGNSSVGSSMSAYVMTLSEVKFLLAEAGLKYPVFTPLYDPQTTFEDGIRASFVRLSVATTPGGSLTAANAYIAANDTRPSFGWTGTVNKIEAIMTQKWIALMHVSGHQSWIDYVRTGFPITPNALNNTLGKPNKLMYPQSEIRANSTNVPYQTSASVFVTGPFWK